MNLIEAGGSSILIKVNIVNVVLKYYDLTCFYFNPGRFHPVYKKLFDNMKKSGINIQEITHLDKILPR